MANLALNSLALFVLALIVALIFFPALRVFVATPITVVYSVFDLGEKYEGHSAKNYQDMIAGYDKQNQNLYKEQVCKRFKRGFPDEYDEMQEKKKYCRDKVTL